jgi:hypothetical protein
MHGRCQCRRGSLGQLGHAATLVITGNWFESPRLDPHRLIIFELEILRAYAYEVYA